MLPIVLVLAAGGEQSNFNMRRATLLVALALFSAAIGELRP
jgi:hypothetical protein